MGFAALYPSYETTKPLRNHETVPVARPLRLSAYCPARLFVVFVCDVAAPGLLLTADRAGGERRACAVGIAAGSPRGDRRARHRSRLADVRASRAAHQINMHVVAVIDVGPRRQHGIEVLTGRGLDVAQEALLFRQAMPAVLHRD